MVCRSLILGSDVKIVLEKKIIDEHVNGTDLSCISFCLPCHFFPQKINLIRKNYLLLYNPLTPVPPVISCDKAWPLFHFWSQVFKGWITLSTG